MAEDTSDADKDKEVELKTPFFSGRAKGYHLGNVLQIVAAVLLALMAMMMYEMRAETKATGLAITLATKDAMKETAIEGKREHEARKLEHTALANALEKNADQQEITNYIFTLSPEERTRLRLQMPDALRRRIIDR